jgi:hypothetical protein
MAKTKNVVLTEEQAGKARRYLAEEVGALAVESGYTGKSRALQGVEATEIRERLLAEFQAYADAFASFTLAVCEPIRDRATCDRLGAKVLELQHAYAKTTFEAAEWLEKNRAAIIAAADARAAEQDASILAAAHTLRDLLNVQRDARDLAASHRDPNTARGKSASGGIVNDRHRTGGPMIDKLVALIEDESGKLVFVSNPEMQKLLRGEAAVDLDGDEVPFLHENVRVKYDVPSAGPQGAFR